MSKRDIRNWFILIFISFIFSCGYLYGRAVVLKEMEYEINKFSLMMSNTYDDICMHVTFFKPE